MNEQPKPPVWADRFLGWFCREEDLEVLQGDLHELFQQRLTSAGPGIARMKYVWEVLSLFRPFAWKEITFTPDSIAMYRHYVKASFRHLKRNKAYSLINVLGLSLGILCTLVLFLKIRHEVSFDSHHADADRMYRIVTRIEKYGKVEYEAGVPYPFYEAFLADFPELEGITFLDGNVGNEVSIEDSMGQVKRFREKEEYVIATQSEYFQLFEYEWLAGNSETALSEPYSVVITDKLAETYFGTINVLGKSVSLESGKSWQITGVIESPPLTTDFPFRLFMTQDMTGPKSWGMYHWKGVSSSVQCYVKLPIGMKPEELESRLPEFLAKYVSFEENENWYLSLQPLANLHSDQVYGQLYSGGGISPSMPWALGLIALIILITACINFVNLNTALIAKRAKEIGVRKVLGSLKGQIIRYFLTETGLVILAAALFAMVALTPTVNLLQDLLGFDLSLHSLLNRDVLIGTGALILGMLVIAGVYPALLMGRMNARMALKKQAFTLRGTGVVLRKSLMVMQFAISQVLIICTLISYQQVNFFLRSPLGFEKEAVIEMSVPYEEGEEQLLAWSHAVSQIPSVEAATFSNTGAASEDVWGSPYQYYSTDSTGEILKGKVQVKGVDDHYLTVYGIDLIAGGNLRPSERIEQVIVNEAFIKEIGEVSPEAVIGKYIRIWGQEKAPIVGVVRNFTTESLKETMSPVVLVSQTSANQFGVRIQGESLHAAIPQLEAAFLSFFPGRVFEYSFLDEKLARFYVHEQQAAYLFRLASGLAILIGCLGLFAIMTFLVEKRTREIGIRKVLGASVSSIWWLFGTDFSRIVCIAFLIATPVAWFAMREWLADFANRIEIGFSTFLIAIGISLLTMFLTIGYRTFKAAIADPIKALRQE